MARRTRFDDIASEVMPEGLVPAFEQLRSGQSRGRIVVRVQEDGPPAMHQNRAL